VKRFSAHRFNRHWPVAIWFILFAFCIFVVSRVQIGADLSAFLPRTPTPVQQLLSEQLRDGVFSRLILIGIEGGAPDALSEASKQLAKRLRNESGFSLVNNGDESSLAQDQIFLLENRYLLSPAVTPEHFTPTALHAALENSLQLLGSPAGIMLKQLIPRDPSGEMLHLLEGFSGQNQPASHQGVWVSHDGKRALLLAQTKSPGFDIDAQQKLIALIQSHFAATTQDTKFSGLQMVLSGPGVFSVHARDHIKGVAFNFSIITSILVSILLLLAFRSWRVLALSLLPVISGTLAGIAAVSLGYGMVYGITLGFGITLIGEAVDYAIFFFTRLAPGKPPTTALDKIWPTLRLGVMTSVCGFSPMFLADFPGFAQLGLFSVVGLIVAVLVTRWVLPTLVPGNFSAYTPTDLSARVMRLIQQAPRLRLLAWALVMAATLFITLHRGPMWSDNLSSLSPLMDDDRRIDESLRRDIGAPDVHYMLIVSGKDREDALERSETVGAQLDTLKDRHMLAGYDTPARYLPSQKTQLARLAALPEPEKLQANLRQALTGLPFRANLFAPFLSDVAAARNHPPITPGNLHGTNLELQTESLLAQRSDGWVAILPLHDVTDVLPIQQALVKQGGQVVLLDLQRESDALYQTYVNEAIKLSAYGALAIVLLLFISLRSLRRVIMVLLPLAAAVIITTAIVLASGQKLLIFHLIGLLLAVAVGSNYSLFFDRESHSDQQDESRSRTMLSLLVANIATIIAFGMLAFSGVPLLTAIGETVAIGAFLSLLFSAVLMGRGVAKLH
jgi:predicted exporter